VEATAVSERDWWLRLLLVLSSPTHVFAWLRDDTNAAAEARQEPILLVGALCGLAGVLSTNLVQHGLDLDTTLGVKRDGVDLAVVVFIAALLYALVGYLAIGAFVYLGEQLANSLGTYRQARHLLAYASVPFALSLLVIWPLRLSLYGSDNFRAGGSDSHAAGVFQAIEVGAVVWTFALLLIGIRTVNGWTWARATAAWLAPAAVPALAVARAYGLI
jgi:Yip1-like protein